MIDLQGLWRDSSLRNQPKGFSPDVRNMVKNKLLQTWVSEPGFDLWSEYLINNSLDAVGIKAVNYGRIVVLSVTEDSLSEIGVFDSDANYTQVLNYNLGFNRNYPMDIEFEYNTKGELIIAFTDGLNTPKVLNIDSPPSPFSTSRIEMFPSSSEIKINSDILDNSGNLLSGAYYPIFKYRNYDASESGWSEVGNPIYITNSSSNSSFEQYDGCAAGTPTSKGAQFTLTNVDQNYDKLVLGIIYKQAGVLTAYELGEQVVSPDPVIFNLTTLDGTVITLQEVLTPSAFYNTAKHLTQTNGLLYAANLSEPDFLNLQAYTTLIKFKWKSHLISPLSLFSSYKVNDQNNKAKGYMHEEVYALYARYKIIGRGWTDWFHIPGRNVGTVEGETFSEDALISDIVAFDTTLQADLSVDATCKYFQTRDTSKNLDGGTSTGDFGYWANEDELYPNLDSYNATSVGGEDLRGQKVRHFRFPSIRKIKEGFYSGNALYGIQQLDALSILITDFPMFDVDTLAQLEGFEIGYAKRTSSNSTVAAQDIIVCGARRRADTGADNVVNSWSASGNWNNSDSGAHDPTHPNEDLLYDPYYLRFHAFDLMSNKPAIAASYLSNQFTLLRKNIGDHLILNGDNQWGIDCNFTASDDVECDALGFPDEYLFAIKDFKYIPNNTIVGKINNLNCESCAWAELVYGHNRIAGTDNTMNFGGAGTNLDSERVYFTNIMNYKKNIYSSFYTQPTASTGQYMLMNDPIFDIDIFGGDTYVSQYGFMTYGPRTTRDTPGNPLPYVEPIDYVNWGVKVVRTILCESYSNIGFRYEVASNQYSKYFPKEVIGGTVGWFIGYDIRNDWNQIQYNSDYSSVNDLNATNPYNPFSIFITNHPNRLIRCKPSPNEQRAISWRTFLANDYFETQRNRGEITNIQGTAENYILINTRYSLFKTVGTEELQTDEFKVVLGTGDIFGRPPSESENDELGYAGCQHKYSCLLTRYGYFFFDEDRKKFFLTGRNLEVYDITEGLINDMQSLISTNQTDNPYLGRGYTASWDERFKRILFSAVQLEFTYSYTPEDKSWTSEHDYIPNVLFNDRQAPFSLLEGRIYRHNSDDTTCQFYNNSSHPSYYVHIFNSARPEYPYGQGYKPDSITKKQETFFNIAWKTDVLLEGSKQRDLTLTQILIWDSYQCSGNLDIVPFDSTKTLLQNQDVANTRRVKDMWMMDKFRDIVVTNSVPFVFKSQAQDSNLDNTRSFELKKRFSDDFLAVKFLFSNEKIGILSPETHLIDVAVNYNPAIR